MPPKVMHSTHRKLLLQEVSNRSPDVPLVLSYLKADPHAAKLAQSDTGNTALHVLLSTAVRCEALSELVPALIAAHPSGLMKKNSEGQLPLHCYLCQTRVLPEIVRQLVTACPQSAAEKNGEGLVSLFLAVMREDAQGEVVRLLCQAHRDGPRTLNNTQSYPLHFAARRLQPNGEVLRILLRRFPEGARHANAFGLLPLHCLASLSDDLPAFLLLLKAYPEALRVPDRQGRLPLHLAVLRVAKGAGEGVGEMEDRRERKEREKAKEEEDGGDGQGEQEQEEDSEEEEEERPAADPLASPPLPHLSLLIERYPRALLTPNNFEATPVDTVLEKTRSMRTKKRVVKVFNLFDHPPSGRLLLLAHRHYAQQQLLPSLRPSHARALRELNWLARRQAVYLSVGGSGGLEALSLSLQKMGLKGAGAGKKKGEKEKGGKELGKKEAGASGQGNIFMRLRERGLIRPVVAYI